MSSKTIKSYFRPKKTGNVSGKKEVLKPKAGPPDFVNISDEEDDQIGEPVSKDIKLLRDFDLTLEYGPCTGITRMQRWKRAQKHGLNPLQDVYDLISHHPEDEEYTLCLWKDYAI